MPPRKRAKTTAAPTEEDELITREASRLRSRAEGHLLQKRPTTSSASPSRIPSSLRKSDGADIVKRNASRKKKYLFVFPGAASFPPGARIGDLTGLDTRNPTLYVDFPPHGRLRFHGSLVFPTNCFTALKAPASAKKPVQVVDTFETLVVFSEWAWVGDERNNPGGLPEPLPAALRRVGPDMPRLWKTDGTGKASANKSRVLATQDSDTGTGSAKMEDDGFVVDEVVESPIELDEDEDEDEDEVIDVVDDVDDVSDQWEQKLSHGVTEHVEPRSNPKRKRKRVNYAQIEDDDDDDDVEVEEEQDDDDDPGYDLGADLDDSGENGAMF